MPLQSLEVSNPTGRAALSFNALVQSWPDITRLAREGVKAQPVRAGIFDDGTDG